jgi:hypothetical protein
MRSDSIAWVRAETTPMSGQETILVTAQHRCSIYICNVFTIRFAASVPSNNK